jgi:hypothetical protein
MPGRLARCCTRAEPSNTHSGCSGLRPLPSAPAIFLVHEGETAQPLTRVVSNLLGNAAIPLELWTVVFAAAFLTWGLAEIAARLVWRGVVSRDR